MSGLGQRSRDTCERVDVAGKPMAALPKKSTVTVPLGEAERRRGEEKYRLYRAAGKQKAVAVFSWPNKITGKN